MCVQWYLFVVPVSPVSFLSFRSYLSLLQLECLGCCCEALCVALHDDVDGVYGLDVRQHHEEIALEVPPVSQALSCGVVTALLLPSHLLCVVDVVAAGVGGVVHL